MGSFCLALVLLPALALGALAWRLAEGPVRLPVLARQVERAVNAAAGTEALSIGRASIAWEGFRGGEAAPLDIRLGDVRWRAAGGGPQAELPEAAITLSARALLRGMVAPATIVLRGPRLAAVLEADGRLNLGFAPADPPADPAPPEAAADPGPLAMLADLMRPASDGQAHAALRRVRVAGGEIAVLDRATGRRWVLDEARLDLRRAEAGGLAGEGAATLRSGAMVAPVMSSP